MSHLPPILTQDRLGRFPMNIPIKSPSPDKYGSNIIAPTLSPNSMNINRIITPVKNSKKYFSNQQISAGKEASTGNGKIFNHSFAMIEAHTNRQSQIISESVDFRLVQSREIHTNGNENHYVKLLKEKEEIIFQLKNIIKMINENNSKSRILYQTHAVQRAGLEHENTEIDQLKHKVKVLTIQNNKLIDIIDRIKVSVGVRDVNEILISTDRNASTPNKVASSRAQGRIQDLRSELSDVRKLLREKQNHYQKEIDELIKSHKSLAIQCIKHETQKKLIEKQNQKLIKLLKEKDESERKLFNEKYDKIKQQDDRSFRSQGSEKALTLIRQQYLQSLKQFKETMTMQAQNIFQTIQAGLQDLNEKVEQMQAKLIDVETFVQTKMKEMSNHLKKKADKKSEIYIQESVSSSISSNEIQKEKNPNQQNDQNDQNSRLIDQLSFSRKSNDYPNQDVSALHQEIIKLSKELKDRDISLKHLSQENDYLRTSSTARQNSIDKIKNQSSRKQNQMISEINLLRSEIDKLEVSYKQQKQQITDHFESELISLSQKYQQQIEQMRKLKEAFKSGKCTFTTDRTVIQKLKQELQLFKDKNQKNQIYNSSIQQQNDDLAKANHQLGKIIESKTNQIAEISKLLKANTTKLEYTQRCNQQILKKLKDCEDEIKIKEKDLSLQKQKNEKLIFQKSALQKQIIEYLSLFNKFNKVENTSKTDLQQSDSSFDQLFNDIVEIQREFDRFEKHHVQIEDKIWHTIQESKSIAKQPSIIDQL